MRLRTMVCTAVAFGVAGFWLGWLTRPHGEAPPSPPPTVQSATPRAVTGLQRGLLCASRFPSTPDEPVDCAVPKLRADWCEGQLDECERSRESVRQQWPDPAHRREVSGATPPSGSDESAGHCRSAVHAG